MNRIEMRGVIVPSEFDGEWFQEWIDKGLIIPESTFRARLGGMNAGEPLDVYINSPGGSVFAANEMANAVQQWRAETKQPVNVTVGAMAASAASMFAISVADKIRTHANSKMMFHGTYTGTLGGAEAHKDMGALLDKLNSDAKGRLVTRYNLAPETVAEWFREGREGWLTSAEMKDAGIADEIIGEDDAAIKFPTDAVGAMQQRGLSIAALLPEEVTEDDGGNDAAQAVDACAKGAEGDTADSNLDGATATTQADNSVEQAVEPANSAGEQPEAPAIDGDDGAIAAMKAELSAMTAKLCEMQTVIDGLRADVKKREQTISAVQSERDKAVAALGSLRTQFDDLRQRQDKLLKGGFTFEPDDECASWEEAMARSGGDYVTARRRFPALFAAYLAAAQTKKGR